MRYERQDSCDVIGDKAPEVSGSSNRNNNAAVLSSVQTTYSHKQKMVEYPTRLAANYEAMHRMRAMMETMKTNQSFRGEAGLQERSAARAQRQTWRQMKGVQLFMHEVNHPGNKPFMIGLG
jgi:DNA-binding transcriptional regulator YbjK